jgi:hypothetical protein
VAAIGSGGGYTEVASTEVRTDASYTVEGVAATDADLVVVAYVGGRAAGEVLIHGDIQGGAVLRPAPITYETTLEARTFAQLAADGALGETSTAELALMLRLQGTVLEPALASESQIEAIADGYLEASRAITAVLADREVMLDAAARQEALLPGLLDHEATLAAGGAAGSAHETFVDAGIDALLDAGVELETAILAVAAAATAFDATIESRTAIRGRVIRAQVLANMRARRRIVSNHTTSSAAVVALVVQSSLAASEVGVAATTTAEGLAAAVTGQVEVTGEALVEAVATLLAPGASLTVQAAVAADAQAAFQIAAVPDLLVDVTTGAEAATAVSGYEANVRVAVEAMVEDSPTPSASVDILTDLFIAAGAAPHIN